MSTTYVAFAAVLGTALSDRVFARGDAYVKVGRAIWVITCWFLAPLTALVAAGGVARLVYHLSGWGLMLAIVLSFAARYALKRRSDAHERRYHPASDPAADDRVDY